jgi:hypothetical protein
MIFESRNIFPTVEPGSVDQQSDFSVLSDERVDLRRDLAEVISFQFPRRNDFQHIGGDNFCGDHAKTSFVVTVGLRAIHPLGYRRSWRVH